MKPLERIGSWLAPVARGMGVVTEQKSAGDAIVETSSGDVTTAADLYGIIFGSSAFVDVHPILAYRLYTKSDVLGGVVHRIANAIAGFTIGLTTDGHDFNADASVIEFLNGASEGYSKRRFFYEIAASYILTNEAWVVLRGRINQPPVARTWVYPFDVVDDMSSEDGLPTAFRTVGDRDRRIYKRQVIGGKIRWIDSTMMNELVPILGAEAVDHPYRGQSQMAPLYYSINQNIEGKRHNTAVLKNGLRLTGALQPEAGDRFDTKALADIQAAIQALRGAGTAGATLVLPKRADKLDLALSNQEMDYIEMLREADAAVYNFYGIPLPLVSNDAATFSNFATAQTALYDTAIFPVFDDIADGLSAGLEPRYPDELGDAEITYNENTIRALKGRNIDRMTKARGTQAVSTNEVREMGGYPEVDGGDVILISSTLVPAGMSPAEIAAQDTDEMPVEPLFDQGDTAGQTDNIQQTALNGSQVESLVSILQAVATGELSRETARALISAAFPNIAPELVDDMLNGVEEGSAAGGEPEQIAEEVARQHVIDTGGSD